MTRVFGIDMIAGDFAESSDHHLVEGRHLLLKTKGKWLREKIPLSQIASVQEIGEEQAKSLLGTAGWAAAGAFVAGPIGAMLGLLMGGNRTRVCAVVTLRDGRNFMGVLDQRAFLSLKALVR